MQTFKSCLKARLRGSPFKMHMAVSPCEWKVLKDLNDLNLSDSIFKQKPSVGQVHNHMDDDRFPTGIS